MRDHLLVLTLPAGSGVATAKRLLSRTVVCETTMGMVHIDPALGVDAYGMLDQGVPYNNEGFLSYGDDCY